MPKYKIMGERTLVEAWTYIVEAEDEDQAIEKIKSNRETNKDVYEIPMDVLEKKYHGCGNGIAVIDKTTRKVVDIDYTTARLKVIKEQNISMCKSAGKIIKEDENTITYRANFSSCQVCLF